MLIVDQTLIARIELLQPAWGAALLVAVGLPVLIHLLQRRPGRLHELPTARFFRQADDADRATRRLRDIARLILRIVALALLAAALMQPRWQPPAEADAPETTGRDLFILLDRSASMQRDGSLFDEAREHARRLLAGLDPAHDRAALIPIDANPQPLLPEPTARLDTLRSRLSALDHTWQHGRPQTAIARARHLASPDRPAKLHIITDAQQGQWANVAPTLGPPFTSVRLSTVGQATPNLAIRNARLEPATPVRHQPATLTATLASYHDQPRALRLRALGMYDDQPRELARRTVQLEPGQQRPITFDLTFEQPGHHAVWIEIREDTPFTADNRTGLVTRVLPARPVHVHTGDPTHDRLLAHAVAPDEETSRSLGVELRDDPPDARTLLLIHGRPDGTLLRKHLDAGGPAIWFIDSPEAAHALARLDHAAPLHPHATDPWRDDPAELAHAQFDHPILAAFQGPSRTALLNVRFHAHLLAEAADEADVLLHFEDNAPALAVGPAGRGTLAVVAGGIGPDQSTFADSPALLPLVHQLIRHLHPAEPAPTPLHPSQPLNLDADEPNRQRLGPDGLPFDAPRADRPGLYTLRDNAGRIVAGRWVQLHPSQSDLRTIDTNAWRQHARGQLADQPVEALASRTDPEPLNLWPHALLLALILLTLEPLLSYKAGGRNSP